MRKKTDTSLYQQGRYDGGRFEVIIKSPTLGLMTRVPADQPDPRYAAAASNVRFDDGVVRNAPGYGSVITNTALDSPPTLLYQANITPDNGATKVAAVLVASAQKLYALTSLTETTFPLFADQAIEFHGEITVLDQIRKLETFGRRTPFTIAVSLDDDMQLWKCRSRNEAEADDGLSYLLPMDYGATTNNVIFVRIGG